MLSTLQQPGLCLPDLKNISLTSPNTSIEFERYYQFRWQQLRKPLKLPIGSEQDEYESVSFHCVALDSKQEIIAVGRISPESDNQMRIRYMAVADQYQQQGIGSMILRALLKYAQQQNISMCWLNARLEAVPFYEKNGFIVVGGSETELAIPHKRMEIYLKP